MFQHTTAPPTPWHPLNDNHWRVAVEVPPGYQRCRTYTNGRQCLSVFKANGHRAACAKCRGEGKKAVITKRCRTCEELYTARHSTQKYCSQACAAEAQRGKGPQNTRAHRERFSNGWVLPDGR